MKNQILVSIILPVYNASRYLKPCLDSLLDQGISKESYEIICVNDGSRDDSVSILKEYAERYTNILVIDKENGGVSAARNKGLDVAQGKYVWFIDADDWVARDFLSKMEILTDDSAPLILTKTVEVSENAEALYGSRTTCIRQEFQETRPFMTTNRGHLFDRALLEKHHIRFDTNLAYGEDLMFMREVLDAIRFANENGGSYRILQCVGDDIYFYRIHGDSVMGKLASRTESVAESILYRAGMSLERYRMTDKPDWYRANYQEYAHLHMLEYLLYYFPALDKPYRAHLRELKEMGLYPVLPPKLGWKSKSEKWIIPKCRIMVLRYPIGYPLYYGIMKSKFKMRR